nr:tetrahydrofolate dehydrogenase/cyclohydrolase catalytic domain-containing protein [uncultured Acetatifactor sp.]
MKILRGLPVANAINEKILQEMKEWRGDFPHLAIIRVGEKPEDISYERSAAKKMEKLGFACTVYAFPADIDNESFQEDFDHINNNPEIHGILLLRPLPEQLDERAVQERIAPKKDLDGMSPINLAKVYAGDESGFAPCTAEAVIEILDFEGIDLKGKRAVVVGRSLVIGKPAAMLLLGRNATVTICHTKTGNLPETCRNAQVLVAAAGSAKMIDSDFAGKDAVVIDVGINVDSEGNLCGDVDAESLEGIVSAITPVPGGVGSVTTSVLAKHLLKAAKMV